MTEVLIVALLTSVGLAVACTALLFRPAGSELWLPDGVRAAVGGVLVGGTALGAAAVAALDPVTAALGALGLAVMFLVWAPVGRDWTLVGQFAWSMTITAGLLYVGYVGVWTVTAELGAVERVAAGLLWVLELFVLFLALGHVWELVDVLARRRWRRLVVPEAGEHRPFVSLHVPTHNEPPEMVISTLEALLALEYDDYEVLLLDNNTDDPALWRPVEEFCAGHERLRFFHLEDWPGYKSGALNMGLERCDPRTEVVGVVDADYQAAPDFLARCAGLFADPRLGFVQTPQDYREWEFSGFFRRLYHSYRYFFDVSQVSRNERGAPIFGGTMGLIRREALVRSGGWDEWCITEDAELSLRLLRDGWTGLHVPRSFGHGIMPLTFEALKRQRFRWCFGGIQILRIHWRSLLPGPRTSRNALTMGQRWAYLVGGLQWYGDVAALAFTGFLVLGALDLALGGGLVIRRLGPLLLLCVVALILLGVVRSTALVRRLGGTTWRDAVGAFGIWLALGWSVALGAMRGLVAREGVFLRTPKVREEGGWRDALRANRVETALAVVCLLAAATAAAAGSLGGAVVALLLLFQAAGYAGAPWNSLAASRSWLPDDLRRRRAEGLRSWIRTGQPIRRGGTAIGVAVASMVGLVVFAAPLSAPVLDPLPETQADGLVGDEDPLKDEAPVAVPTPAASEETDATSPSAAPTGEPTPTGAGPAPTPTQIRSQPTRAQPTQAPPTQAQPTQAQPTQAPPTQAQPTQAQPTQAPTDAPSTRSTTRPTETPSAAGRNPDQPGAP